MKLTKVIINSVTVKDTDSADPLKVLRWEYTKDGNAISEAELIVPKDIVDLLDLSNGQVVEIHGGTSTSTDQRFFYGNIDTIKPDGATYIITCSNEMKQLVRKNVNKVYDSAVDSSAGEVSAIVKDLIETFGGLTASVQSSGTSDGQRVDEFKCINTDIYERIFTLKKALNWDLFYNDDTRVVHFQPKGFVNSGKLLRVKEEILGLPEWDIDTDNMINDLRVDGATIETDITESGQVGVTSGYTTTSILLTKTPNSTELLIDSSNPPTTQREGGSKDASSTGYYYINRENKKIIPSTGTTFGGSDFAIINYQWSSPAPIHMINQASIDLFGFFQKTVELTDITSVADAESRATNILSRRSIPFVTGQIKVKLTDVPNRGELVEISDTITPTVSGNALSGTYSVNSIKYMWPSAFEEIEVGDSQWRLADWQQSTEERLKRLEEQFVRNQDILTELVDINNTSIQLKPRYRKIITETMTDGSNFILGHSVQGLLGSDKLGRQSDVSADHFIQQFEDTYTEDFIDDDFEGAGTATGWTSGSVDFTSGQIALSKSIDFNNGGITQATLTSTEVSGSFDYTLSNNGGTSFEAVTSGTKHTFSSSSTIFESYLTDEFGKTFTSSTNWVGQTFTIGNTGTNEDFTLSEIMFKISTNGNPGTLNLEIYATSAGLPTGSTISTGTLDGNLLTSTPTVKNIPMSEVILSASTKYALIIHGNSVDSSNSVTLQADQTSPSYTGGSRVSSPNSGSSWVADTAIDYYFSVSAANTDLRWKATENAASTGEILKIIVEDYH